MDGRHEDKASSSPICLLAVTSLRSDRTLILDGNDYRQSVSDLQCLSYSRQLGFVDCPSLRVVVGSMSAASLAIYGMYKHMIHGNFGTNYGAWYLSKTIAGRVMGGFAGVVFDVISSTLGANTPASHATLVGVEFLADRTKVLPHS